MKTMIIALILSVISSISFANHVTYAPNRILVEHKAGVNTAQFESLLQAEGAKKRHRISGTNYYVVEIPKGQDEPATAMRLRHHPLLKNAEVDKKVHIGYTANDPLLSSYGWHINNINANTAWDISTGSPNIKIAILDTGTDCQHPDLAAHCIPGWNFFDDNGNTDDVYGHGTATAGTAAAIINNDVGAAGVAGNVSIMPIRISDVNGWTYWSTVATALTWAADNGAKVANVSFGGVSGSYAVQNAASYFRSKGGVVVVSAGNSGTDTGFSATDTMIVVSATDSANTVTSWSSFGSDVDLAAPGQNIITTTRGGGYGLWWGTSFSAPIVAGVAALVKSVNPLLSAAQVDSILTSTATDLGSVGYDTKYGFGLVNAGAAVLKATTVIVDTTPPVVNISSPINSTLGGTIGVYVVATDNIGVSYVDLYVNGTKYATDTTPVYSFAIDTKNYVNGTKLNISSKAYDASNNVATSTTVTIIVYNAPKRRSRN